jgi:hypothetical protein
MTRITKPVARAFVVMVRLDTIGVLLERVRGKLRVAIR